ncbi:inactive protein RESTRICTED TEV MOVEMENT 2 isoform X3 [Medicago truncatula]|uniref:inactive protein RESTRICTED TEV MOVEMENT 2 isoform X3 n=1 Tax=Medicago truncatula TaxID=3880 RepID=UPI0019675DBC|nr:inactive protein RESTRICTED TEV MOVEMENT 2 isoform X3 [Medicago truncatula]
MDTKTQPEADRVYEDFEPYNEWDKYDGRFTVMLPGYRRDQMKVQVTSKPALRLIGERPTFQNRWRRFKLEFPIPSDYDTDSVTATFEGGKLTVKFAKLTNPKETTTNPPEEAPRPKEPSQKVNEQKGTPKAKEEKAETNETTTNPPEEAPRPKESPQKADEQKGAQEGTPKAIEEKAETKTNDVSDQTTPPKENDTITEKRTEASIDKVAEKVRTNGSAETIEAATSNSPKTKDAKFIARCKTRLVDFTLSKALCNQDENEALGNSTTGLKKWKRLVACVMLILLIVGLGLYCRNTFGSSQGELDLEELLLFPY